MDVPVVAGEVVGVVRPVDVLDLPQRVPLGVAALRQARRQVDYHARIGVPVGSVIDALAAIEYIRARAAVQIVVTRTAVQCVVALSAPEAVVFGVADEVVGVAGSPDLLDPRQRVALGVPALRRARGEVDRHARVGVPIVHVVVAFTAVEHVRALAAHQVVVTRAAVEPVRARVAVQLVVARTAVQCVVAGRAVEPVRPRAAFQPVVARAAMEIVAAVAAFETVVALVALQIVVTGAALQRVVAASAFEVIVPGVAGEVVGVVVGPQDVLDPPSARRARRGRPAPCPSPG